MKCSRSRGSHPSWRTAPSLFSRDLSLLSKDNIFIIRVDLAHGCILNCRYCYFSAAGNKKQLLTQEKFIDILDFLSDLKDITVTTNAFGNPQMIIILRFLCKESMLG